MTTDLLTRTLLTRPTKQLPPDDRDMRIFQLAEIHGWTHADIAREVELTRRRVSQVVEEVRSWLARHPADAPELKAEDERRMYERNLERMRLQDIMLRAVQGLDRAPPTLTTTRTTENGGEVRTTREQPPVDVRLLRMYQRAVTALGNLDREPLPPAPPPPPLAEQPWMHEKIREVVARWQLKSHSYIVSDECFEKFAADLTTAFLGCVEELLVARQEAETALGAADEGGVGSPAPNGEAQGEGEVGSPAPNGEPMPNGEPAPTSDTFVVENREGASQISLPEVSAGQEVMAARDVSTTDVEMTSVVPFARNSDPAEREIAAENIEKGNETGSAEQYEQPDQYEKPLLIGRFPADHPVLRPIRPLPIRRVAEGAIAQVRITPQHPGAELSASCERMPTVETIARQERNELSNRESSESNESGRNH